MSFDPVEYAQAELSPILNALCALTEGEEQPAQHRFFAAILAAVNRAKEADDLAEPFMELSMSAFVGFEFSPSVAMMLDELLAKAQRLSESLSLEPEEVH